jgi:hypothetical protein
MDANAGSLQNSSLSPNKLKFLKKLALVMEESNT